jgi:tRNA threonylcarbamoyladenosine biosynthesis protein TsaE
MLQSTGVEITESIGVAFAGLLRHGDVVVFSGELGSGKTACTRGIGRGLGANDPVTSPTFTIMREHALANGGVLLHLDAYRLAGPDDLEELGLLELLDRGAIAVIEWGERVGAALGDDLLVVRFSHSDTDDDVRVIEVEPLGPRWLNVLPEVEAAVAPWVASC